MPFIKTIILFLGFCSVAFGYQGDWHENTEHGFKLRIISDYDSLPADGLMPAAVEFDLGEWKIYGQEADDIGLPTRFDFSQSENIKHVEVFYPPTKRLDLQGIISQAYEKHVAFPILLTAEDSTKPIVIKLTSEFLACSDICIPIKTSLSLPIDATQASTGGLVKDIESQQIRQDFLPAEQQNNWLIWFSLIGFSLLGGLILNIMPCVLPALALKAFSFSQAFQNDGVVDRNKIRKSFLFTGFGIMTCFLVIGGILVVIKFFGGSVGWGVQYQQPAFLALLLMIMLLFSGNLLGLFEVQLPQGVMQRLTKFLPIGNSNNLHLGQDFLLGFLATILATPCSAPFLSTALGVALIVGGFEAMIIFLFLGLGMALPYFVICALPQAVGWIPKPGGWMRIVKFLMSGLLFLTSLWLFWLLSQSHSLKVALMVLFLTLGSILYLYFRSRDILAFKSPIFLMPSIMLLAGFLLTFSPSGVSHRVDRVEGYWQVFDESLIESAISDGKVVFVDVTADWCVTCKFNKFRVLEDDLVSELLSSSSVLALRADWTFSDSDITSYLRSFGRAGVPMNVVYGVGARDGIILSEILSVDEVLFSLRSAGLVR